MGNPNPYRVRSTTPDQREQQKEQEQRTFAFPFGAVLPVRDPHAGVSFGSGGMRGAFQAGVVRAFVMTGYFPKTLAGTSIGSVSATILAAASELTDRDAQVALVEGYANVWLEHDPAEPIWKALFAEGAALRALIDTVVDLPRDLGEVGDLVRDVLERRWWTWPCWVVRAVCRLPCARTTALGRGLWRRVNTSRRRWLKDKPGGVFRKLAAVVSEPKAALLPDGRFDLLQVALEAFGMDRSLTGATLDHSPLAAFMREHIPRMNERTLGDFVSSELSIPIANISTPDEELGAPRIHYLSGKAKLAPALRASCAFVPVFLPERARMVFAGTSLPKGYTGEDVLIDPGVLQRAPLSPVISAWKQREREEGDAIPSYRLFAVYLGPRDETEVQRAPGDPPPELIEAALRVLRLRGQEDLQFDARVVSLITQLVRAVEVQAPEGSAWPTDSSGNPFVPVDVTAIAPDDLLPLEVISAPRKEDYRKALALGCKATLAALHAKTIDALAGPGEEVTCKRLLDVLDEKGISRAQGYLKQNEAICRGCDGVFRASADRKVSRHVGLEDVAPFEAFAHANRTGAGKEGLDVVVPAGGVFRGVFQVGAIAALNDYHIRPELYAGASVGTIFSYFLDASNANPDVLYETVKLMQEVPQWVDGDRGQPGRFEVLRDRFLGWWKSETSKHLRALSPRQVVDLFSGRRSAGWELLSEALQLSGVPRAKVVEWADALVHGRLAEVTWLLDILVKRWRLPLDAPEGSLPELIGLDHLRDETTRVVFKVSPDVTPTMDIDEYSRDRGVRFVFTVTDHDRGTLVHLGAAPNWVIGSGGESQVWPRAIQSPLAASSFPIAFRLRTQLELFDIPPTDPTSKGSLFTDGGTLNNFPSDSAFAYLRALATKGPQYEWLGKVKHRVLLLSLTEPWVAPRAEVYDPGVVPVARRAMRKVEDEKIYRTLVSQAVINQLAKTANAAILGENGRGRDPRFKPAIRADFVHIAPAQTTYASFFAYKPELGFTFDKQNAVVAAGCRRTRIALEWEKEKESGAKRGDERRLAVFNERVRESVRVESAAKSSCLLGSMTPDGAKKPCPFAVAPAKYENVRAVYKACCDTAHLDEPLRDLVGRFNGDRDAE